VTLKVRTKLRLAALCDANHRSTMAFVAASAHGIATIKPAIPLTTAIK